MGELASWARLRNLGGGAGRRRVAAILGVAALTGAALGASGDCLGVWEKEPENATLEEAFFETLWRCESPLLTERNEAEDALFKRFAEFEPIWQDRRFLTNGEIGAEARQRFELAEARYRDEAFEDCVGAFRATFEQLAPEGTESQNREEEGEGGRGENRENREDGGNGELLRGRVRLRWEKPLRIVYLAPDWSAFERRDEAGNRWRPNGRFSTPELAPEFDASELTLETTWERVDGDETALDGINGENEEKRGNSENAGDGEGGRTVVGVFEGLVGGDFRVWRLPLGAVAVKNAETEGNGENERESEEREVDSTEDDSPPNVALPTVFQSGDAVATVGETTINEKGETTARVRFDFAEAFDAFDSHRVWFDKQDFVLTIDDGADKKNIVADINASATNNETRTGTKEGETGKVNEAGEVDQEDGIGEYGGVGEVGAGETRWTPIRWRVRERSANGALFELDFPNDVALREAVAQGRARLACRTPRFLFWTRFEVAGIEKEEDCGDFNAGKRTAKGAEVEKND